MAGKYRWLRRSVEQYCQRGSVFGATSATLTITGASTALSGNGYRCIVTGVCCAADRNIKLRNTYRQYTDQHQHAATKRNAMRRSEHLVYRGGNRHISNLSMAGKHQWRRYLNNISNGGIYGGATSTTLTLTGVTAGMNNNQYRCVVSGAAGCGPANSSGRDTHCKYSPCDHDTAGQHHHLRNTEHNVQRGLPVVQVSAYQWQESINGCAGPWNNIANGGIYSGATTSSITLTAAPFR